MRQQLKRKIQGGRALPGFLTAFHKQQVWLAVPDCGWHRWWAGQTSEDAGLSDGSDSTRGDHFKVSYVSVVSFLSDGSQPGLWGWTIEPELSFCFYCPSHLALFPFVHPYSGAIL